MKEIEPGIFTGERALFASHGISVRDSVFEDGESPLKESRDVKINACTFKWKYPLWYCKGVLVENSNLLETARSGIWYTEDITVRNSLIEAPKTFRRAKCVTLECVSMPRAQETLWSCEDVTLRSVSVTGDYFGMNSKNVTAEDFTVSGNYLFDGAQNVTVKRARLLSKDAFWNAKNVVVEDSYIVGEYLGWNSENVTFINCTIDSNQGLCYMKSVKLVNCKTVSTDLAFEYSTVEADLVGGIDSVKNPTSAHISADSIGEIILEPEFCDPEKTQITIKGAKDDEV